MARFHALIRTHHITSRKKVSALRAAARAQQVACVLRSGGVPGLMYVRGRRAADVQAWVDAVHALRYKDYKVVAPPMPVVLGSTETEGDAEDSSASKHVAKTSKGRRSDTVAKEKEEEEDEKEANRLEPGLSEVAEVKDFGKHMDELGLREWWRAAMGFAKD